MLGDLVTLEGGGTPSRHDPTLWGGGIPWASVKDLTSPRLQSTEETISPAGVAASATRLIRAGHVVVATRMAVGRSSVLEVDAAINQDLKALIPRSGKRVHSSYLQHLVTASVKYLEKHASGATVKGIRGEILENLPVPHPDYRDQKRIADILDKADHIRRKRKEAIVLIEELLRSTFLEMFGDPVTNPKGWSVKDIGELADVASGLQVTPARITNSISVPYLRVANVYRDSLDLHEIKEIRITAAERDRAMLRIGDVLVVEGHGNPAELGRTAVWNGEIPDCTHQNHLIRVRGNVKLIRPRFLSAVLNSSAGRAQMLRLGKTTSGLNTISTSNVRSVRVIVPPVEIQDRFDARVRAVRNLGDRMRKPRPDEELFGALMEWAFDR